MAANLDKAESALTTVSDLAYIRGVDASGNSVKISKSDLASVLGVNDRLHGSVAGGEGGSIDTEIFPGTDIYSSIYKITGAYWKLYFIVNHNGEIYVWITEDDNNFPPAKSEWKLIV